MIRRDQLRRGIATALSALLLGGVLGAVVHDALETHGVCLEHGDAVHMEAAPDGHDHRDAAETHDDGLHVAASDEHDGSHGHCEVRVTTQLPNEQPATPPAVLLPIARALETPRFVAPAPSVPLYQLAPKSSPPA